MQITEGLLYSYFILQTGKDNWCHYFLVRIIVSTFDVDQRKNIISEDGYFDDTKQIKELFLKYTIIA